MVGRVLLTLSFLLVSLVGDASPVVPDWKLDMKEGEQHYDQRQYLKAVACFERVRSNPAVSDSADVELQLLRHLMYCYDALYNQNELINSILRLRKKARDSNNKAYESMSLFMGGKWLHYTGRRERGYSQCQDAVELMVQTDYAGRHVELSVFYGELVRMLTADGRYDEAARMSELQETEARQPVPEGFPHDERSLRRAYALRACLLAKAGRMAEADRAYTAWQHATGGNAIDDMDVYDYLWLRHKYREAQDVVARFRDFVREQGDTISFRMLSVCDKEASLFIDMGEYEKAVACGKMVGCIADSLHIRRSYDVMNANSDLFYEQQSSQQKTLWLACLAVCFVAVCIVGLVVLYYVRIIRKRNLAYLKLFNSLDAYRRAVVNASEPASPEVMAALEKVAAVQLPNDVASKKDEEPDDEDRRLFVEMDTKVTRDRLFLKPGLGREDLMRLIGVDKNRFGKMMSKYSDASNTSVYINTKRVEYGAKLLVEHPEFTVATVATECGMSTPVTFNRLFKETYNMTPSEYRERMMTVLQAESRQKA